jgi:hypothetical protein
VVAVGAGETVRLWSKKYPDPLVLRTLKLRVEEGGWVDHTLDYRCRLGEEVVLVVKDSGDVEARTMR